MWVMIETGVVVGEVLTVGSGRAGRDGGGRAQGGGGSSDDDGGVAAVMVVVGKKCRYVLCGIGV